MLCPSPTRSVSKHNTHMVHPHRRVPFSLFRVNRKVVNRKVVNMKVVTKALNSEEAMSNDNFELCR